MASPFSFPGKHLLDPDLVGLQDDGTCGPVTKGGKNIRGMSKERMNVRSAF